MKHILLILALLIISPGTYAQGYKSYFTGNKEDITTDTQGGIVLMGGSSESDEAMRWFLERASGGDILVLRASGSDGYNNYMFSTLGLDVNSVESIVITGMEATGQDYLFERIQKAEAIWFAGGNQFNYVKYFRDSPVRKYLLEAIHDRNIVVGGTSAGMAILGGYYFAARRGSISSDEAISQPFHERMTVEYRSFLDLPFLSKVITDTHYSQRKRQGRHIVFMARGLNDTREFINGIACDESTAVAIDENGKARVFTKEGKSGSAYFIQPNCSLRNPYPEIMNDHEPISWYKSSTALMVYEIPGDTSGQNWFNLKNWIDGAGGNWQHWWINEGKFSSQSTSAPTCKALILRP